MGSFLSGKNGKTFLFGALAVLMLVLIALGTAGLQSRKSEDMPPYLSFSADADGLKGLYTLLSERAGKTRQWRESWRSLPQGTGHTLIAVQPGGIGTKEEQPLLDWVAKGNRLLLFSQREPAYLAGAGVRVRNPLLAVEGQGASVRITLGQGGEGGSEGRAQAPAARYRLSKSPQQAQVLLADGPGIVAASYEHGTGSITVVVAPEWLRNDRIMLEEHFELIWPILRQETEGRTVWFDEYHHGYTAKRGLTRVFPAWLLAMFAQAALCALLWLWLRGKRFGPVQTPREWVVRRGDETLTALAGWYRRRSLHREAIVQQGEYLRQLLQERWGIRTAASPEEASAIARLYGGDQMADRLETVLERIEYVRQSSRGYSSKEFVKDSMAVARVVEAVERRSVHK